MTTEDSPDIHLEDPMITAPPGKVIADLLGIQMLPCNRTQGVIGPTTVTIETKAGPIHVNLNGLLHNNRLFLLGGPLKVDPLMGGPLLRVLTRLKQVGPRHGSRPNAHGPNNHPLGLMGMINRILGLLLKPT